MRIITLNILFIFCIAPCSHGWQFDFSDDYWKNFEKRQHRDAKVIWREIDKAKTEKIITTFVSENQVIDGINLEGHDKDLEWKYNGNHIRIGDWILRLDYWDNGFPKERRKKWDDEVLHLELQYQLEGKVISNEADGLIRLHLSITREKSMFKKGSITPELLKFEYGQSVFVMPLGGIEIESANKTMERNFE